MWPVSPLEKSEESSAHGSGGGQCIGGGGSNAEGGWQGAHAWALRLAIFGSAWWLSEHPDKRRLLLKLLHVALDRLLVRMRMLIAMCGAV